MTAISLIRRQGTGDDPLGLGIPAIPCRFTLVERRQTTLDKRETGNTVAMPEMTKYEPGTPSWVDIGVPDIEKSATFYGGLFGWTFESAGPVEETGGYGVFTLGGKNVAGLGPQMDQSRSPYWSTYVSVSDVEATLARADADGGAIVMPAMDVMEAGRMAIFTDPVGAQLSIWQPKEMTGADLVNEPGALCWNELNCSDTHAASNFYERVFNWVPSQMDMGGMAYTLFMLGGNQVAGMMRTDGPARWNVSFAVADCDATVAKATELGGSVLSEPTDLPVGRFAVLADPDGADFGVIKLAG
jgi:predicted enzyme related to lactoylglutathione lyase